MKTTQKLQLIQDVGVQEIISLSWLTHVTQLLCELYFLPRGLWVKFKVPVVPYAILHDTDQGYIQNLLPPIISAYLIRPKRVGCFGSHQLNNVTLCGPGKVSSLSKGLLMVPPPTQIMWFSFILPPLKRLWRPCSYFRVLYESVVTIYGSGPQCHHALFYVSLFYYLHL